MMSVRALKTTSSKLTGTEPPIDKSVGQYIYLDIIYRGVVVADGGFAFSRSMDKLSELRIMS